MTSEKLNSTPSMETSMGSHSLSAAERLNRGFRVDLSTRVDHILYTEWDPIGIRFITDDCEDEYRNYVPKVVRMLQNDWEWSKISDFLWSIESDLFGETDSRSRRRCDVIAILLAKYGPNNSEHPFTPTIAVDTPERAYQTVLDLVTQTRLDAYEKDWNAVCVNYERAVAICRTYLPDQQELIGTCLNNMGQACSELNDLDSAQTYFEAALLCLGAEARSDDLLYLFCINNLIANLQYRNLDERASEFVTQRAEYLERNSLEMDQSASLCSDHVDQICERDVISKTLVCSRLPVVRDSRLEGPRSMGIE